MGSQTVAGTSANKPSEADIQNSSQVKVSVNYDITYVTGKLTVTRKNMSTDVTASLLEDNLEEGAGEPTLIVRDGDTMLVKGKDFIVEWFDEDGNKVDDIANAKPGTYSAVLTGLGNYMGTFGLSLKLTISKANGQGGTAIEDVRVEERPRQDIQGWYDMRGRKLSEQPTTPGIYIHNGRKVMIR